MFEGYRGNGGKERRAYHVRRGSLEWMGGVKSWPSVDLGRVVAPLSSAAFGRGSSKELVYVCDCVYEFTSV